MLSSVTDIDATPAPLAAFAGPVTCRHSGDALTLTGIAADSGADILILTFIAPVGAALPDRLAGAAVRALDERRYSIVSGSRDWALTAASVHVHRDIGNAFYRAVPVRPAPLSKRLFWGVVLALAGTRGGKRLLFSLRRRS